MLFRNMKIEDASAERRQLLQGVMAQLEGKSAEDAGTVGINVLIHVIMAECASWGEVDSLADEIAQALRDGCRAQVERALNEHRGNLQ